MMLIVSHQKTVKQFCPEHVIPANNGDGWKKPKHPRMALVNSLEAALRVRSTLLQPATTKEAYNYTALLLFDIQQDATPETCNLETFSSPITADVGEMHACVALQLELVSHPLENEC